ncbi:MAG: hypothetical protein K0R12_64 [Gammaproteobacteria bacterium]|nr:hypothetical protein [Gammaproteobacteria bacterium]
MRWFLQINEEAFKIYCDYYNQNVEGLEKFLFGNDQKAPQTTMVEGRIADNQALVKSVQRFLKKQVMAKMKPLSVLQKYFLEALAADLAVRIDAVKNETKIDNELVGVGSPASSSSDEERKEPMRIQYIVDPAKTRGQNAYYIDQIYRQIRYAAKKNEAETEKNKKVARKVWDFCIALDTQDTIPSDKWKQIFDGLKPLLLDIVSTEKKEEGYKERAIKEYIEKTHRKFAEEREGLTKELSKETKELSEANKELSEENKRLMAVLSIMLPNASAEQKQALLTQYPDIAVSVFPQLLIADPSDSESSSSSISASSASISLSSASASHVSFLPPPSTESKKKPASSPLDEIDSSSSKVAKTGEGVDVKTTSFHSAAPQ